MASKEQNALIAEQTVRLKAQLNVMRDLANAAQQIDFGGMANGFVQLNSAIKSSGEQLNNFKTGQQTLADMNKAAQKGSDDVDKMGQSIERFGKKALKASVVVAAIEGAAGGFSLTANAIKMLTSVASGLVSTFFNLASSIIALPFKILYGLMNNVGQGGTALREEFEKVRGTFGDLTKNEGRDVIQSWRRIDHFGGQLAETGLSIWRTMGNMAESMAAVREIAEKMGPLFHNFSKELNHNGERIFAYKKGLHLTDEGLRAVTEQAARTGASFEEVGRHITSTAFALGDAFAMNGATISQDVGTMIDDFDHFGNLSVKKLSQVSVYARKLGIEIDKLTGSLDAFADFDKAAENVSQLSQAFGMQLDTLQMVKEQDPAANMDRLRKAFFATGRSVETMTRQSRALLAQTTGLDQKTLSLAFSQKNAGVSYAEIQKQGANAETQQLSQVEAMERLSNSIQRLVKQGPQLKGGFFDIFIQGFFRGVKWTREFWGLMRKLRYAMRMTYRAGRRVGQMFVKYFPGIKDMLRGMGDLFDRRRWRRMLRGVVRSFKEFFKDLTTNPSIALSSLFKKLKTTFFDWFDATTPSGRKVLEGFKTFLKTIGIVFGQLVRVGVKGLSDAIRGIVDFIKDPSAFISGVNSASSGFLSFLVGILEPAWKALKDTWPALKDALLDLLSIAWEKIKPGIVAMVPVIVKLFAGSMLLGALSRSIQMLLVTAFTKATVSVFSGSALKTVGGMFAKGVAAMTSSGNSLAAAAPSGGGAVATAELAAQTEAAGATSQAAKSFSVRDAGKLGLKLLAMAAALALGGLAITFAVIEIKRKLDEGGLTSPVDVIAPLLIIASTVGTMVAVAAAAKLFNSVGGTRALGKAAIGFVVASVAIIAIAGVAAGVSAMLSGISLRGAEKMAIVMSTITAMFFAAIPILAVATVIGALVVSGPWGAAAGAAALVGIAAISLIISLLAAEALKLTKVIKNVPAGAGFEQKANTFVKLMQIIGTFTSLISDVLKATAPTFSDIISSAWGHDPRKEANRTIGKLTEMINAIGGQVQGIARSILETLRNISIEDLAKGAQFADILQAIASLAKALTPPDDFYNSDLSDSGALTLILSVTLYIKKISKHLGEIIPTVKEALIQLSQVPDIGESKIKVISAFLTGIGGLIQAFSPSGAAMGVVFQSIRAGRNGQKAKGGGTPTEALLAGIGTIFHGIIEQINVLLPKIKTFIKNVVNIAKSIPADKIKQVELVGGILASVLTAIGGFVSMLSPENLKGFASEGPRMVGSLSQMVQNMVGSSLDALAVKMPELINKLFDVTKGIDARKIKRVSQIIPVMSSLFDLIGSLTAAVNELGKGGTDIASGQAQFDSRLGGIQTILTKLFSTDDGASILTSLKKFGDVTIPRQASTNATRLKVVLEAASALGVLLTSGIISQLSGGGDKMKGVHTFFAHLFMRNWNAGAGAGIHWLNAIDELGKKPIARKAAPNATKLKEIIEATGDIASVITSSNIKDIDDTVISTFNMGVSRLFDTSSASNHWTKSITSLGGYRVPRNASSNATTLFEIVEKMGPLAFIIKGTSTAITSILGTHTNALFNALLPSEADGSWVGAIVNLGGYRIPTSAADNANNLAAALTEIVGVKDGLILATTGINKAMITRAHDGITAIVNNMESISAALNQTTGYNLATKLTKLNHDLGLHSTGNLTLAQEPVNLNVNFTINIDAAELEEVLLKRDDSNIATKGKTNP